MVLDQQLSGPLSLVVEFSALREQGGVDKVYHLLDSDLETECDCIIYLCRPDPQHMYSIARHIKQHQQQSKRLNYWLYLCPRRTVVCERVLEEEGVYGDLIIGDCQLDLIPFDTDLLSFEYPNAFRELYLEGDYSCLAPIASYLMKLQAVYGIIPKIYAKGRYSKMLMEMLTRLKREAELEERLIYPEIENLIIIDRDIDLITPLLNQLTFEGCLDEQLSGGINATFLDVDNSITGQPDKRKIALNSSDALFARLRNENFSQIGQLLNQTAARINSNYQERHAAQTVGALKDFVSKLGALQQEHQSLRLCTVLYYVTYLVILLDTNLAEFITKNKFTPEFIRNLEAQQSNKLTYNF